MLCLVCILLIASARSGAIEAVRTFGEKVTGWVSTVSVTNTASNGLASIRAIDPSENTPCVTAA